MRQLPGLCTWILLIFCGYGHDEAHHEIVLRARLRTWVIKLWVSSLEAAMGWVEPSERIARTMSSRSGPLISVFVNASAPRGACRSSCNSPETAASAVFGSTILETRPIC